MSMSHGCRKLAAMGLTICLNLLAVLTSPGAQAGVWTTRHNLSTSGPGPIKAITETRVCVFCHIPHNASPAVPLWGHVMNGGVYTVYTSSTVQGALGQPNGASKQCLACHDGAVAVGAVIPSRAYPTGAVIALSGTSGGYMPAGARNLGANLSDDHPVSLLPATGASADPEIVVDLPQDAPVQYDSDGRVQCTSCHDPHDDTNGKFLVQADLAGGYGSQICVTCHLKAGWAESSHRNSANVYGSQEIKAQACAVCHKVHTAPIPARLLAGAEEGLCNTCHNGSAAVTPSIKNVAGEFARAYKHPTDTVSAKHDPAETFDALNDPLFRHAECADCHNPHRAQPGTHAQGTSQVGAVLLGSWGMKPVYDANPWTDPVSWQKVAFTDTTGADMLEAYLCLKCHRNLARDFNPNNPSYHAVLGAPKASLRGMYLAPWTRASRMTCSDCHTSSNQTVKGPHGSEYAANGAPQPDLRKSVILFADWLRGDGVDRSRGTGGTLDLAGNARNSDNDLCFKCHDRRVYGSTTDHTFQSDASVTGFSNGANTNYHADHMMGYACTVCHVVHGSNKKALLADRDDGWDLNAQVNFASLGATGSWNCMNCHSPH